MLDFLDVLSLRFSATLPQALAGLMVVAVAWVVARLIGAMVMRLQSRVADDHKDLVNVVADVVGWAIFVMGIIAGLGTAGVNVTALVAGLGLTGFAVGFALKDILANAVAGILIMMFRPFGRGEQVRLDKHQGVVESVDLRYTTLTAPEGRILIPNAKAYTEVVVVLAAQQAGEPVREPVSGRQGGIGAHDGPQPQSAGAAVVQPGGRPQGPLHAAAPVLKVRAGHTHSAPSQAKKGKGAGMAAPSPDGGALPHVRDGSTPRKRG